jgi:23S rRNA pseudouridine1911/1915/1917 synthase
VNAPRIVHECKHLLALAKPYGMPSQNDPSGDLSLVDWAGNYLGREAKLLHRLDRPTGGIVLLGKSAHGTRQVSKLFAERAIEKTYLAVTAGTPDFEDVELHHHIGKLPGKNFVRAYDKPVRGSKEAKLKATFLQQTDGLALLSILPSTGRRHQIRAQLRAVELHILGDFKYGKKARALPYPGIALWAYRLIFCFGGETLSLTARPPEDYPWALFSNDWP